MASPKIPPKTQKAIPPATPGAASFALDKIGQKVVSSSWSPDEEQKRLQKRARKKAISKPLAARLAKVAKSKGMLKQYNRTLYRCGEVISQSSCGKVISYYCKARHCVVCGSIRTAIAIGSYGDELKSWDKKYLVTLTIPNVSACMLRPAIKRMLADFRRITRYLKAKHPSVKMLRSLEVSYNGERKDFHPHFHCIVDGYDVGKHLLVRWLEQVKGTSSLGQDIRLADDASVLEVFKYAAKLSQECKGPDGKRMLAPAWALDEIFSALKSVRCLGATGFSVKKEEPMFEEFEVVGNTPVIKQVGRSVDWDWEQKNRDWVDKTTGEMLTEYQPSDRMEEFISKMEHAEE